jgi:transcriptional regulator with XRE-family HTH domain
MTTPRPPRPPVMDLIAERRRKRNLSLRRAGDLAGISEARWRQLESGFRSTKIGWAPEPAPDRTLARMAAAVGMTPAELEGAGYPGAAELLAEYLAERDSQEERYAADAARMVAAAGGERLTPRRRAALEAKVTDALREVLDGNE